MIRDYSKFKVNNKYYSGSEKKIGITVNGEDYIVKFQTKEDFNVRYNHISEYIGSQIFGFLGFNVQSTMLGYYKGDEVVVIKDFNEEGSFFVPFNGVGESSLDDEKEGYSYSYDDITRMLEDNKKLTNIEETISSFWDIYIVDALLANFDRHGSNWGFIKKEGKYKLSPVFDNGSCLFPKLIDEYMIEKILNDESEINKRVYDFPTSQIKLNDKKSSYYEVISSLQYEECNKALVRMVRKINLEKINSLIDEIQIISPVRKTFYKRIIKERYEKILLASYKKLVGDNYE